MSCTPSDPAPPSEHDAEHEPRGRGLVLGKFMPPHLGHIYLVEFARARCAELHVLVCSLEREPIPGHLRHRWMSELFPDVHVHHVTDENPGEPSAHPDFWRIWHDTVRRAVPAPLDFVFASEDYGHTLAQVLGARYVAADPAREKVPISATRIRAEPLAHLDFIAPPARSYFLAKT